MSASADSPSTITVSWSPPSVALQNGVITHYRVSYTPDPSQSVSQWPYRIVTATSTTLTGLQPLVNYTIAVSAGTSVGLGPFQQIVVTTLILSEYFSLLYAYYILNVSIIIIINFHHL